MVFNKKYSLSFTAASVLMAETLVIAEEYYRIQDWNEVKDNIKQKNLMNKIKENTFQREFAEIKKRLQNLTIQQLNLLINGSPDDSKAIVLLSLLKTYSLFKDFVIEIIRSKYLLFDTILSDSDYNIFFENKAIIYNELNKITEITKNKVKQVIFRMLEQTGLINSIKDGIIVKPFLSDECISVIIKDDSFLLAGFLFSDSEIKIYGDKKVGI